MNKELKNSISKFNKVVANFDLELLAPVGKIVDLKLHQVHNTFYKSEDFEGIFNEFCQYEYEHFLEILDSNNLEITYMGRSSSFYIHHSYFDLFSLNNYCDFWDKSPLEKLEMLILNEINQLFDTSDFTLLGSSILEVNEEYIDHEDIDMLTKEIEGTIDILKDIKRIYDYIDSVKERQCELFLGFKGAQEF